MEENTETNFVRFETEKIQYWVNKNEFVPTKRLIMKCSNSHTDKKFKINTNSGQT